MQTLAPAQSHTAFRARLKAIGSTDPADVRGDVGTDAVLGVGFLIGAGLPHAAAAFASAVMTASQNFTDWPWCDAREPPAEH